MKRSNSGTLIPFFIMLLSFGVTVAIFFTQSVLHWITWQGLVGAADAAALAGAAELSKVVIDDPRFGYVALSDWTPGRATLNSAGEPMEVKGINSIMAACCLNLCLAESLNNAEIKRLAQDDLESAILCCHRLEKALNEASAQASLSRPHDRDGNVVSVYEAARRAMARNRSSFQAESKLELKLELGYLNCAFPSGKEADLSRGSFGIKDECLFGSNFRAFCKIPVAGQTVFFAGLGDSASLVSNSKYRPSDGTMVPSILKARVFLKPGPADSGLLSRDGLLCFSAAAAFANKDLAPCPGFSLHFPHGMPSPEFRLSDLLEKPEFDAQALPVQMATGGDFPADINARLKEDENHKRASVADLFAGSLHNWIISCHGRVRLDSLVSVLHQPLRCESDNMIGMIVQNGSLQMICCKEPVREESIRDRQLYVFCDSLAACGRTWTFMLKDHQRRLGLLDGGKHAGLPLLRECYVPEGRLDYFEGFSLELSAPRG